MTKAEARLALYIVLGLALRAVLYVHFPALLTNDSPDYVRAGVDLFWTGNFDSFWLRDVRMPGYPLFLAALYPLAGIRSDLIILAQIALGLLCIPLGWQIGRRLHSQPTADALALFFALNPVYLLLEHTLMTEALALFAMVAFTVVAVGCMHRPPSATYAFAAGALLGICTLIRINLFPFCTVLLAAVVVRWAAATVRRPPGACVRDFGTFLLPLLLGVALTLGPWLWRNHVTYGGIALSEHSARSLLLWKTMSGTMDDTLPLYRQYSFGHARLDFAWLHELGERYPTQAAEIIAGAIVGEQIYAHQERQWLAIAASALNHAGIYREGYVPRDDRAMVAYWFSALVPNPVAVETSVPRVGEWLDFRPITQPSLWSALWGAWGTLFLQLVRPLLVAGCLLAAGVFARRVRRGAYQAAAPSVQAVAALVLAYLGTLAFHAFTLTGSDRFASISDWVALLIVVFVASHQQHPAAGERQPDPLARPRQPPAAPRR